MIPCDPINHVNIYGKSEVPSISAKKYSTQIANADVFASWLVNIPHCKRRSSQIKLNNGVHLGCETGPFGIQCHRTNTRIFTGWQPTTPTMRNGIWGDPRSLTTSLPQFSLGFPSSLSQHGFLNGWWPTRCSLRTRSSHRSEKLPRIAP